MTIFVTAVGIIVSILYIIGVPEVSLAKKSSYYDEIYEKEKKR